LTENLTPVPMSFPDIGEEEIENVKNVLKSGWYSQGKVTNEFENLLSKYLSSKVVTVNNGSSALMCALLAHGIKPGDKVVVPSFTFAATSSIPKILGAEILVADIDPNTLNISPESVEEIIKKNDVKMVIVVDVGGLPVDIDRFIDLSKKYNFILIEDAAEAFGSEYKNKKVGSFEHTAIFSFHIAKPLTTVEGGCISTNNEKIIEKSTSIRDHGREPSGGYVHQILGSNFRTNDIQSAIGICQLRKIEQYLSIRNTIANEYKNSIKGVDFQKIPNYATKHSYMLFFTIAKNKEMKEKYLEILHKNKIDARDVWPPINKQPCNPELNKINCPNSEQVSQRGFILPIFNTMSEEQIHAVISSMNI